MSRRANPPADRAAQNQQTIKNLLKLDCNKTCADCKRSKHPRWASWNLGVFVCIRCSGIHRGMGTHISRVKSVDLDAWTDEQLQSVLKWGNARANKYWESKLAPGHVPSDAKMENFIRTKYEAKRWVMDGPMPDPATLDVEGDDDVPLAVVQEKAKVDRSTSQRASASASQPPSRAQQKQAVNLFDDDPPDPPARPNTTDISSSRAQTGSAQAHNAAAPQKQAKAGDSLLGLDFFGPAQGAPPSRPSSTTPSTSSAGQSRPDLKQSILSLYASAPKPQSPPQQHERNPSFGSLASAQSPQAQPNPPKHDAFGGLTDAFSGLSFPSGTSSTAAPKQSNVSAFDSLTSPKSPPSMPKVASPPSSTMSGGGFFDSTPALPKTEPKPQQPRTQSVSSGNNLDLIGATMGSAKSPAAPPSKANDTFDLFSSPAVSPPAPSSAPMAPAASMSPTSPAAPQKPDTNSIFNLSSRPPQPEMKSPPAVSVPDVSGVLSDPWGGGNAWDNPPEPASKAKEPSSMMQIPDKLTANDLGAGWGASTMNTKPTPTVSGDEDFGGFTTAAPNNNNSNSQPAGMPKPPSGFGGADDLFSNVWE